MLTVVLDVHELKWQLKRILCSGKFMFVTEHDIHTLTSQIVGIEHLVENSPYQIGRTPNR